MLKKLLIVAMVATTMLGGVAWGAGTQETIYYDGSAGYRRSSDGSVVTVNPTAATIVDGTGDGNDTAAAAIQNLVVNTNGLANNPNRASYSLTTTSATSRLGLDGRVYDDTGTLRAGSVAQVPVGSWVNLRVGNGIGASNGVAAFGVVTPTATIPGINFDPLKATNPTYKDQTKDEFFYIGQAVVQAADASIGGAPANQHDAILYVGSKADVLAKTLNVTGKDLSFAKSGVVQVAGKMHVLAAPAGASPAPYTSVFGQGGKLILTNNSTFDAQGGVDIGGLSASAPTHGGAQMIVDGNATVITTSNNLLYSGNNSGQLVWGQNATGPKAHSLDATGADVVVNMSAANLALMDNTQLITADYSGTLTAKTLDIKQGVVNMGGNLARTAVIAPGRNFVDVKGQATIGSAAAAAGAARIAAFAADGLANTRFEGGLKLHYDGILTGSDGAVIDGTVGNGNPGSVLELLGGQITTDYYGQILATNPASLRITGFDNLLSTANNVFGDGVQLGVINASDEDYIKTSGADIINAGTTFGVKTATLTNTNAAGTRTIVSGSAGGTAVFDVAETTDVRGDAPDKVSIITVDSNFHGDATFHQNGILQSSAGMGVETVNLGTAAAPGTPAKTADLIFDGGILDAVNGVGGAATWTIHNAPNHDLTSTTAARGTVRFVDDSNTTSTVLGNINAAEVHTLVDGDVNFVASQNQNYSTFSFTQDSGRSLSTDAAGNLIDGASGITTTRDVTFNGGESNLDFTLGAGGNMRVRDSYLHGGDQDLASGNYLVEGETIDDSATLIIRGRGEVNVNNRGQYNISDTFLTDGSVTVGNGGSFNAIAPSQFGGLGVATIVDLLNPNRSLSIANCGTLNVVNDLVVTQDSMDSVNNFANPFTTTADFKTANRNVVIDGLMNSYFGKVDTALVPQGIDTNTTATLYAGNVTFGPNGKLRMSEQLQSALTGGAAGVDTWAAWQAAVDATPEGTEPPAFTRNYWMDQQLINANSISANVANLSNNADGLYYSLYGTYLLQNRPETENALDAQGNEVLRAPRRQVVAIDAYRSIDLTTPEVFLGQMQNMGYNTGNMNYGQLEDLNKYATTVIGNGGGTPVPVPLPADIATSEVVYDQARLDRYFGVIADDGTVITPVDQDFVNYVNNGAKVPGYGNNTSSLYNPLATDAYNLQMGVLGAIADGSRYYKVNLEEGEISGNVDKGLLDFMNGASIGNVLMANWRTAMQHENLSLDRIYRLRSTQRGGGSAGRVDECGMPVYTCGDYRNDFWVAGVGQWDNASESNGFDGYKYHSYGFAVGYEHKFNDSALFGASFMYTRGDFEDKEVNWDNSRINNYSGNVYLSAKSCSGVFGTLLFGYTNSDNKIDQGRGRQATRESYDTHTYNFLAQAGFDAMVGDNFMLTPSIGVGYLNATAQGHDGWFANKQLFNFGDYKYDTFYIPLEVRANYNVCITSDQSLDIGAKAGIAYMTSGDMAKGVYHSYGFRDVDTQQLRGYNGIGRDYGHWNAMAGAGIQYNYKKMWVGVDYQWNAMKDFHSHDVNITAGIKF